MGSEEKNIFFFSFAAVLHRAAPKSDQRETESGWFNFFLLLSFDFPSSIARQNARMHERTHVATRTRTLELRWRAGCKCRPIRLLQGAAAAK